MKKNNMRLLIAVGLIALIVCSWYTMISDSQKAEKEYMVQITTARQKVEEGLYQVAMEHYSAAMKQRDSLELRNEIAQFYQDHGGASSYESFCEDIVADFPTEIMGYERLASFYKDTKAYDTCFNIMETAQKRGLKSKVLDSISAELAYVYDLERCSAVVVSPYSFGFCALKYKDGLWGFVNGLGSSTAFGYTKVTPYSAHGVAVAHLENGRVALIDASGKQIRLSPEGMKIEDSTAYFSSKMALKYNGKYHYCDSSFKELFGAYDYAGTFNDDVAAVKEGSKWAIIDESGNNVTEFVYDDVKLDDVATAFHNKRAFVKQNGEYILIDTKGKRIGNDSWKEVDSFNKDMIAAVKKDGKWGFVDADGKVVVDYTYDEAKSFSSGMAAVLVNGKWGYISSEDYQMKIEPAFVEAIDFTPYGTAFVKEEKDYKMLRLYRLT